MERNTLHPSPSPDPAPGQPLASGIRPKAFRRPPHWVSPDAPADAVPGPLPSVEPGKPSLPTTLPATRPNAPTHQPHKQGDPAYGVAVLMIVVLVNLAVAFALGYNSERPASLIRSPAPLAATEKTDTPGDGITLYSTPLQQRRTARYLTLDRAHDETDGIEAYHQPTAATDISLE